jgi:hypothetical protein
MTNVKSLFFALFLFTVAETMHGQTNTFDIGIEGSPSLIFLRGNPGTNNVQKPTIGFSSGIFAQFNFNRFLSLRTNIAYERKGTTYNFTIIDNNGEFFDKLTINSNFDYLTFPILLRGTFGKKVQFFVNAGPYFGRLMKQTSEGKGDVVSFTTRSYTSSYKRIDTGLSTGIGFSVPIKTKFAISFEVRNNLGLNNVSALPILNNGTIKTNSTNFLLGLTYKLGQQS